MKSKINDLIQKIKAPFYQGLSKRDMINAFVLSLTLTVFPVFGTVTILLTMVALRFKLNLPLMIVVSYIATPLQFLLFLPFITFGETIFGVKHSNLNFEQIQKSFEISAWNTVQNLLSSLIYGISGWFTLAIPIIFITIYFNSKFGVKKYH